MEIRKGIILAGGHGTRLSPLTNVLSKQLLPVYDKPMIYYPLSTLMLIGIKEILIISSPSHIDLYKGLLKDGNDLGLSISYEIQESPRGLAEAFIIGEKFLNGSPSVLVLGDNLYYGHELTKNLRKANENTEYSTIFAYKVNDAKRYGVVEFDENSIAKSIEEKPINPRSNYAITGLYFYDENVSSYAKEIRPSKRGELEITDLNERYMKEKKLKVEVLGRGIAWLDTGTFESLLEAGSFIRTIEERQGLKIGCIEEVAWRLGYIDTKKLTLLSKRYKKSKYGEYLLKIIKDR